MRTKITFEEACALPKNFSGIDVKTHPLFVDASKNPNCDIYSDSSSRPVGLFVIVKDTTIADNVIGFEIHTFPDKYGVWLTKRTLDSNISGVSVCEFKLSTPLSEIIQRTKIELEKCPVCGKAVKYKDQHTFSFAGRCCADCLPRMRKEHEYPGWYN